MGAKSGARKLGCEKWGEECGVIKVGQREKWGKKNGVREKWVGKSGPQSWARKVGQRKSGA